MRNTATSPSPSKRGAPRHDRPLDLVVLANPASRRVVAIQHALARCTQPPARVIPYIDYIERRVRIARLIRPGSTLRIESPGQDFEVERAILEQAIGLVPSAGALSLALDDPRSLTFERGRILAPKQWYCGFSQLLDRIEHDRAEAPPHRIMNDEKSIARLLFDKSRCHDSLSTRGIPCPRALGKIGSYDELRARMRSHGISRVFVKLLSGSSASGVVALESNGQRTQAFTTVEMVESQGMLRFFNSRRIRRLEDERLTARLIDTLAPEGVHVERWVPKAGIEGHAFDVRVVLIAGHPDHAVIRLSRSPMTNLHLLNRRGHVEMLRDRMGASHWEALLETCRLVGGIFPDCHYLGIDVAVLPGYRRHVVLEVNAFGDFLPGVLDSHQGRDTHMAEIDALAGSMKESGS